MAEDSDNNEDGGRENDSDKDDAPQPSTNKQEGKKNLIPPLNRPIIMICNSGYNKTLLPLKDLVTK